MEDKYDYTLYWKHYLKVVFVLYKEWLPEGS